MIVFFKLQFKYYIMIAHQTVFLIGLKDVFLVLKILNNFFSQQTYYAGVDWNSVIGYIHMNISKV